MPSVEGWARRQHALGLPQTRLWPLRQAVEYQFNQSNQERKHMAENPSRKAGKPAVPETLAGAAKASFAASAFSRDVQRVALEPTGSDVPTPDQALWGAIRNRTAAASFTYFERLVELVFCRDLRAEPTNDLRNAATRLGPRFSEREDHCYHGTEAYNLLKAVAEVFVTLACGMKVEPILGPDGKPPPANSEIEGEAGRGTDLMTFEQLSAALALYLRPGTLPYLDRIISALKLEPVNSPLCDGLLHGPDCFPCMLELIWSYWHEEGMLVQSLNALCLRFQNKRSPYLRDPLAALRLAPLRPLNTLLWGYIQDEVNRLTLARRAYEYDHEYGLRLVGKAVPELQSVDSRSKFLEAFHNLLNATSRFYKEGTTQPSGPMPSRSSTRCANCISSWRKEPITSSAICPGRHGWKCSSRNGCCRARRSANSSAAPQWSPTRRAGWHMRTR